MRSASRTALKLLLGVGILTLVLQFVDMGDVLRALRSLQPEWVAASMACFVANRVLMALKWWVLMGGSSASISFPTVQRALCLSDYYGLLFPNSLAVDATRVILLRHSREGMGIMAAAILADRVVNVAMTALISLMAMGISYAVTGSLPFSELVSSSVLGISLFVLVVCVLVTSRRAMLFAVKWLRTASDLLPGFPGLKKVLATIEKVHGAMSTMLTRRQTLLPATGLALLVVLIRVTSIFLLFIAIGAPQTYLLNLTLVPAISLIALLPISILGLGLKDGAFVVFFGGAGVPASIALGVSFTSYAVIIGGSLLLGILASFIGPPLPTAQPTAPPTRDEQADETNSLERPPS